MTATVASQSTNIDLSKTASKEVVFKTTPGYAFYTEYKVDNQGLLTVHIRTALIDTKSV